MTDIDQEIEMAKLRQAKNGTEDKHIKLRYRRGKAALAIIVLFIGWFLFTLYWPYQVTELDNIIISTDPVSAGQYQRYTAETCNNEGKEGEVTRNLVLEGTDEAPISTTNIPVRPVVCTNIILIPSTLPNGKYEVHLHIKYHVNPLRDALNPVTRDFRSQAFEVEDGRQIEIPSGLPASQNKPDNQNREIESSQEGRYDDGQPSTPEGTEKQPEQPETGPELQSRSQGQPDQTAQNPMLDRINPDGLSDQFKDQPDAGGLLEPFFTLEPPLVEMPEPGGSATINTEQSKTQGGLNDGQSTSTNNHPEASAPEQLHSGKDRRKERPEDRSPRGRERGQRSPRIPEPKQAGKLDVHRDCHAGRDLPVSQ